jgi:predicted oxidoreductase (fatty acid repression mutant protein)
MTTIRTTRRTHMKTRSERKAIWNDKGIRLVKTKADEVEESEDMADMLLAAFGIASTRATGIRALGTFLAVASHQIGTDLEDFLGEVTKEAQRAWAWVLEGRKKYEDWHDDCELKAIWNGEGRMIEQTKEEQAYEFGKTVNTLMAAFDIASTRTTGLIAIATFLAIVANQAGTNLEHFLSEVTKDARARYQWVLEGWKKA